MTFVTHASILSRSLRYSLPPPGASPSTCRRRRSAGGRPLRLRGRAAHWLSFPPILAGFKGASGCGASHDLNSSTSDSSLNRRCRTDCPLQSPWSAGPSPSAAAAPSAAGRRGPKGRQGRRRAMACLPAPSAAPQARSPRPWMPCGRGAVRAHFVPCGAAVTRCRGRRGRERLPWLRCRRRFGHGITIDDSDGLGQRDPSRHQRRILAPRMQRGFLCRAEADHIARRPDHTAC